MYRVTARQAYTRARSKKEKKRLELGRSMVEAKNRYIRQLSSLTVQDTNRGHKPRKSSTQNAKITDFFASSTKAWNQKSTKRCSSINSSGIEVITIDDDTDDEATNNDHNNNDNSNKLIQQIYNVIDTEGKHDCTLPDIKPFHQVSNLGNSFQELDLSVRVDDDIEIVTILPPIPLRNHQVFELDSDNE